MQWPDIFFTNWEWVIEPVLNPGLLRLKGMCCFWLSLYFSRRIDPCWLPDGQMEELDFLSPVYISKAGKQLNMGTEPLSSTVQTSVSETLCVPVMNFDLWLDSLGKQCCKYTAPLTAQGTLWAFPMGPQPGWNEGPDNSHFASWFTLHPGSS